MSPSGKPYNHPAVIVVDSLCNVVRGVRSRYFADVIYSAVSYPGRWDNLDISSELEARGMPETISLVFTQDIKSFYKKYEPSKDEFNAYLNILIEETPPVKRIHL